MKNSKKCSNLYTDEGIRDSFEFPYESSLENIKHSYAAEMHEQMLFSTAVVLFIFIMIINLVLSRIQKKAGDR